MVRTTEHTCKDCNKIYASYQSLCNHRTKYHKNENNSIQQHDNSIEQPITAIESVDFNCRYCDKSYKHQQSRSRHEIICKKTKNHEIIEKNNSQIIENQHNIQNNGTMNTNNGTINNNITINNYGQENLEYLKDKLMKDVLTELTKLDYKNAIPRLAQHIHFNPYHKENNNLEINSIRSKTARAFINGKWKHIKKDDMLKEVHNKIVELLQKWVNTHRLEITRAMMGRLKDYKFVDPSYIKKIIHEEINILGYVYFKNHMEQNKSNEMDC